MTARDEAIATMQGTGDGFDRSSCTCAECAGELLDAIPADVLVRLAMERGALQATPCPFTYVDEEEGIQWCSLAARSNNDVKLLQAEVERLRAIVADHEGQ